MSELRIKQHWWIYWIGKSLKGLEINPRFKQWRFGSSFRTTWRYLLCTAKRILDTIWTSRLTEGKKKIIKLLRAYLFSSDISSEHSRVSTAILLQFEGQGYWFGRWEIGRRPSCAQLWTQFSQQFARNVILNLKGRTGSKKKRKVQKRRSLIPDSDGDVSEPWDSVPVHYFKKKEVTILINILRSQNRPLRDTKVWCGGFPGMRRRRTVLSRRR